MLKCVLSVDAGGTYLKAALVTTEGEIIADTFMKVPVNSDGELDKIVASYKTLATTAIKKGLSDIADLKLIEIVDDIDNTPIYGAALGAL